MQYNVVITSNKLYVTMFSRQDAKHFGRALILLYLTNFVTTPKILCHERNQTPVVQDVGGRILIPNLYPSHYRFWLKNHPKAFGMFEKICSNIHQTLGSLNLAQFRALHSNISIEDPRYLVDLNHGKGVLSLICSEIGLVTKSCWGYETNCQEIYLMPECYESSQQNAKTEQERKILWFTQADFGYILERRKELNRLCLPDKYSNETVKSSFECTKYFRMCRGHYLMLKFNEIPSNGSLITNLNSKDLIKSGNVGGWNCDLQLKRIQEESGQRGVLQSWFNELEKYSLINDGSTPETCDVTIDKPAIILKLDSTSNMYHYFCSFLNLYATIHLNNDFSDDTQLVIWDNHLPRGKFEQMWSVFSRNELISIKQFENKRVCFKKFVFALPPRIIDGLYYNTPLVSDCFKSGLFDAFNKHVLYKLNVSQAYDLDYLSRTDNKPIRTTIVSRSTSHRRILNEIELKSALNNRSKDYIVEIVDYGNMSFLDQLNITQNTDILIGLHGAGLTHTLFLPDWAALFELYDCQEKCYYDLARLRGVSYFSITNKEKIERLVPSRGFKKLLSEKFPDKLSDYEIDETEFVEVFERAVNKVRKDRMKYFQNIELIRPTMMEAETKKDAVVKPVESDRPDRIEL